MNSASAWESYKESRREDLDLITGLQLVDGETRLFAFEGLPATTEPLNAMGRLCARPRPNLSHERTCLMTSPPPPPPPFPPPCWRMGLATPRVVLTSPLCCRTGILVRVAVDRCALLERRAPNSATAFTLMNTAITFPARLYNTFEMPTKLIKLRAPLPQLLLRPDVYEYLRVAEGCRDALLCLGCLLKSPTLRHAFKSAAFPQAGHLLQLEKKFGGVQLVVDREGVVDDGAHAHESPRVLAIIPRRAHARHPWLVRRDKPCSHVRAAASPDVDRRRRRRFLWNQRWDRRAGASGRRQASAQARAAESLDG